MVREMVSIIPDTFSGLTHATLSLSPGGYLQKFRAVLRRSLLKRMVVTDVPCSREAELHKQECMRIFAGRGKDLLVRLIASRMFPTGDWRRQDAVEVYTRSMPSTPEEKAQLMNKVADGIVFFTTYGGFPTYAAHRWTGADLAIDSLGLLESISCSFSHAYTDWCDTFLRADKAREAMEATTRRAGVGAEEPAEVHHRIRHVQYVTVFARRSVVCACG